MLRWGFILYLVIGEDGPCHNYLLATCPRDRCRYNEVNVKCETLPLFELITGEGCKFTGSDENNDYDCLIPQDLNDATRRVPESMQVQCAFKILKAGELNPVEFDIKNDRIEIGGTTFNKESPLTVKLQVPPEQTIRWTTGLEVVNSRWKLCLKAYEGPPIPTAAVPAPVAETPVAPAPVAEAPATSAPVAETSATSAPVAETPIPESIQEIPKVPDAPAGNTVVTYDCTNKEGWLCIDPQESCTVSHYKTGDEIVYSCFISGNYPNEYTPNEHCTVHALVSGNLTATTFQTEAVTDTVTINGKVWSDDKGPRHHTVNKGDIIEWKSDSEHQFKGFEICLGLDTHNDFFSLSRKSSCKLSGEFCLESVNFPSPYPPNDHCSAILLQDGYLNKFRDEDFDTEIYFANLEIIGDHEKLEGNEKKDNHYHKWSGTDADAPIKDIPIHAEDLLSWTAPATPNDGHKGWKLCMSKQITGDSKIGVPESETEAPVTTEKVEKLEPRGPAIPPRGPPIPVTKPATPPPTVPTTTAPPIVQKFESPPEDSHGAKVEETVINLDQNAPIFAAKFLNLTTSLVTIELETVSPRNTFVHCIIVPQDKYSEDLFKNSGNQSKTRFIYNSMPRESSKITFKQDFFGNRIRTKPYKVACKGETSNMVILEGTPYNNSHPFFSFLATITTLIFWILIIGVIIWCAVCTLRGRTRVIQNPDQELGGYTPARGRGGYVPPSVMGTSVM